MDLHQSAVDQEAYICNNKQQTATVMLLGLLAKDTKEQLPYCINTTTFSNLPHKTCVSATHFQPVKLLDTNNIHKNHHETNIPFRRPRVLSVGHHRLYISTTIHHHQQQQQFYGTSHVGDSRRRRECRPL